MPGMNRFRCQVEKEIMRCDYAVPPRARNRAPSLSVGFTPIGSYNWKLQATLPSILVFLLGLPWAHPGRSQCSLLLVAFSCELRRDKLDGSGCWLNGSGSSQLCAPPRRARRKREPAPWDACFFRTLTRSKYFEPKQRKCSQQRIGQESCCA